MKKIKIIYFDIGGVLVDHILALRKIARELQISEDDAVNLFKQYGDEIDRGILSWEDFEVIFYNKLKPTSKLETNLSEAFVNNFKIIQETHDLIYDLEDHIDIGILSNVAEDVFKLIQFKNLIPNISYKVIVKSAEIKLIKPGKEIFNYALEKAGFFPSEILFVDDSEANVIAAKSFGWNSVLFNTQKPVKSVKKIRNNL